MIRNSMRSGEESLLLKYEALQQEKTIPERDMISGTFVIKASSVGHKYQPKEKSMKSRSILFIILAFVFSACAAPNTLQPAATPIPTNTTLPSPELTLPPTQAEPSPTSKSTPAIAMTTYADDVAGFSLDYPAGWFLNDLAAAGAEQAYAYSVGIATWDLLKPSTPSGKGQSGIPEGGTKIDVNVVKQSMTLEEAVTQQTQNESGSPILARKDVTLANGLPGVILDMEGFAGLTRTLITVLNGNVIYVSGYGNLEHFETIALSVRAK